MIRVLAVSGSLRMEKSDTALVLNPFLEGIRSAGASVELIYVKRLKVKPCIGDFHCWYTKPGVCCIKDDMQLVYPKLKKADILVLATPVYIPLPGEMQNFVNRLCPLLEPALTWRDGRTRGRIRKEFGISKIVLVSSSGWWELGNFGTVVRIAEELAKDVNVEFAGAVLRPHAFLLLEDKEKAEGVYDAARRAGAQLVKEGKMSKTLLDAVAQPLISEEELRRRFNASHERAKAGG